MYRYNQDTMSSNIDQHHILSLIDTLRDKYQIQDGEYKQLVEALAGKNEPLDVSTATVVKITFDEHRVEWKKKEFGNRISETKLLRVVDDLPDPENGCPLPVDWAQNDIQRSALEEIADAVATSPDGTTYLYTKSCECCYDERVLIKKVEVLK